MNQEQIRACISACAAAARACRDFYEEYRADAGMLICVINCRDCADLCDICVRGLESRTRVASALCLACAAACELCAAAFRLHGPEEPYRRCAEACCRCAAECRKLAC